MGLQVIEWRDETGTQIVHRWPAYGSGEIRLGAQLVVRESQTAVFFRDGHALDVFGPGRHTLTTLNLPLLGQLVNLAFGGHTPFQSEVYFVNMRTFTQLRWGTVSPVIFRDKELAMVRLRAHGLYTMRIQDPQLFVNTVVGTEHRYDTETVSDWLRDFIVARFNDIMGEVIETVLDLPQRYDELAAALKARLQEDFARYGMELIDLLIEAIVPPEEVVRMIDQRTAMEAVDSQQRFLLYRTAQAIGDMPQAAGEGGGAAAAGAGIGAGIGMGAAMAQAVAGAMRSEPTERAPQGPPSAAFCSKCGAALPAGARFCPGCGQPVAQPQASCPNCGAQLTPGARFCSQCGHSVTVSSSDEGQAQASQQADEQPDKGANQQQ
jgi:membrane protease subunit (stomatin/prohibitin family)